MNRVEHIKHHGKPYVAMPVADYERMLEALEDASDVATVQEALAALGAGEMETFPAVMVYALADAETVGEKITIWRKHRRLSKAALGRVINVSGQFIGQIESGQREGGPTLFRNLADALQCSADDLI